MQYLTTSFHFIPRLASRTICRSQTNDVEDPAPFCVKGNIPTAANFDGISWNSFLILTLDISNFFGILTSRLTEQYLR